MQINNKGNKQFTERARMILVGKEKKNGGIIKLRTQIKTIEKKMGVLERVKAKEDIGDFDGLLERKNRMLDKVSQIKQIHLEFVQAVGRQEELVSRKIAVNGIFEGVSKMSLSVKKECINDILKYTKKEACNKEIMLKIILRKKYSNIISHIFQKWKKHTYKIFKKELLSYIKDKEILDKVNTKVLLSHLSIPPKPTLSYKLRESLPPIPLFPTYIPKSLPPQPQNLLLPKPQNLDFSFLKTHLKFSVFQAWKLEIKMKNRKIEVGKILILELFKQYLQKKIERVGVENGFTGFDSRRNRILEGICEGLNEKIEEGKMEEVEKDIFKIQSELRVVKIRFLKVRNKMILRLVRSESERCEVVKKEAFEKWKVCPFPQKSKNIEKENLSLEQFKACKLMNLFKKHKLKS